MKRTCLVSMLALLIASPGQTGALYHFVIARNITDSNGGNVMRWVLSNPTWDSRYPTIISRIGWANALGPPSLGTSLADAVIAGNVFGQSLGWLLGCGPDLITGPDLHAPTEIRDLQLVDQSCMGLLHRQAHALTLSQP